jgi:hypothetical protein
MSALPPKLILGVGYSQITNHPDCKLLCLDSKRPCRSNSTDGLNEIAPSHCLPFRLRTNATRQLHQGFATGGIGFSGQFALHKSSAPHLACATSPFGSVEFMIRDRTMDVH